MIFLDNDDSGSISLQELQRGMNRAVRAVAEAGVVFFRGDLLVVLLREVTKKEDRINQTDPKTETNKGTGKQTHMHKDKQCRLRAIAAGKQLRFGGSPNWGNPPSLRSRGLPKQPG